MVITRPWRLSIVNNKTCQSRHIHMCEVGISIATDRLRASAQLRYATAKSDQGRCCRRDEANGIYLAPTYQILLNSLFASISMSTAQFRYLLIASLALGVAGGFFDTIFPSAVPEVLMQAHEYYTDNLSTSMAVYSIIIAIVGLIGYIAAFIGLFTFRPWAPNVAVFSTVLLILASPAMGASVFSGWAYALTELSSTLWGIVLAVVYFSPIKDKFTTSRSEHGITSQKTPISKNLAHPGKRFQGQFIDGLVAFSLGFVSFYLFNIFTARELAFYSGATIGATYFLFSDSLPKGQSIGKKLLNIQVLSKETMKPCSLFQSFLRNITFPLGIFDWAPIFFGERRRLGDFIASTIVVKKSDDLLARASSGTQR